MTADVIAAPRRLALIAAASFLVPMSLVVLAYGAFAWRVSLQAAKEMTPERIAERIQVAGEPLPSAQTAVAQQPATAARSGESVYATTCVACHGSGAAGAPKFGDHAAWQPRVQQGLSVLVQHAIQGKGAMPPKGGNPTLTKEKIRRAVQYMTQAARG